MRKLKNDDRGVTLVEIIVSIAILAIIVLPFLNAFVTATKTNVKAKKRDECYTSGDKHYGGY